MEQNDKNTPNESKPTPSVDSLIDAMTGLNADERKAVYNEWMKDTKSEAREQYQADDATKNGDGMDWLFGPKAAPSDEDTGPSDEDVIRAGMSMMDAATEATLQLTGARRALLNRTLELNDAKARYEDARVDAFMMGTIVGKNAEEREARLASLLDVYIHSVRAAEREWLKAKVEVECAIDTLAGMDRLDRQTAELQSMLNR